MGHKRVNHHHSRKFAGAAAGVCYLMIVNYGPGPSTFKIIATVAGGSSPAQGRVVSVSAASFNGDALASDAIVAAFGSRLATTTLAATGRPDCPACLPTELAGTKVVVKDSAGTERLAPLSFVSPNQVNYLKDAHKSSELFGAQRLVAALHSQPGVDRDSQIPAENEKRRQVARTP